MARERRTIQVLLLEDAEHLGEVGDIVDVRPGYARNYLFRTGAATPVTPDAMRGVARRKKEAAQRRAARAARVAEAALAIEGLSLTIEQRASEEGHLFGSVSAATIAEALLARGIEMDEKQIQLETHIKELGIFSVSVRLDAETTAEIRVWVVEPGS